MNWYYGTTNINGKYHVFLDEIRGGFINSITAIGQILNITSLANECGVAAETAKGWLSVLETSYIIYLLKLYYRNFNKRLVESVKLYFYDTGLACSLLGIKNAKQHHTVGKAPAIYFWRDSNNTEIDLSVEKTVD
ncbi:MAG: DUF4143 domain-containing protein [Prevotellaceae bacterium]|jgi:predicted AAA+ superfamily ATPase|nr:DUF4143 domain-containing protein [Prevotellaceae bacterium]